MLNPECRNDDNDFRMSLRSSSVVGLIYRHTITSDCNQISVFKTRLVAVLGEIMLETIYNSYGTV